MGKEAKPNRLIQEKSPYLLQHAYNPVDWYPWSEEAFQKAKQENKLIFLSIGYSTCHWCHVMERESFEALDVARLMNQTFVSIKVDREERPDIDSYYMGVCQMLTGTGGWPLTIFMSPDRKPFFAATYLPRQGRYGRPGLLELIPQIENAWRTRREEIIDSAHKILEQLVHATPARTTGELDEQILHSACSQLTTAYDETAGGFGSAPKFPTLHNLFFLLRCYSSMKHKRLLAIVEHTLSSLRMGGIYDHIGFGFHRYSTDAGWRVPHFEKMLYDQALLLMAYTEAFQITKKPLYRVTAEQLIEYVLRDMTSKKGAFYSAQDADSEGEEGKFYVWTDKEIGEVLNADEARILRKTFNINPKGNFEHEATGQSTGSNILYITKSLEELSNQLSMPTAELSTHLKKARGKLFARRENRIHPHKDEKILCDWTGMMIAALSKAGRILENTDYIQAAERAADFILTSMRTPTKGLYHRFIDGEPAIPGFLDDYAFLTWGLIELYEATFETKHLAAALDMNEQAIRFFWDHDEGAFYFTPENNELPLRKKEIYDGAIPSGNSVAMLNMVRLARLTGRYDLENMALQIPSFFAEQIKTSPLNHIQTLTAFGTTIWPSLEIVVSGHPQDPVTKDMIRLINNSRIPDVNVVMRPVTDPSRIVDLAPFTRNLLSSDGKTTAYVCEHHVCKLPTNDINELAQQLADFENTSTGN